MASTADHQHGPRGTSDVVPEHQDAPLERSHSVSTKNRKGKRKTRGITNRGPGALPKNRGTGFEEYFADPPMTPDEAAEEKYEIYADVLSFEERIQSCIQRFRARRRLQGKLTLYFDEYLFLGGVDTSANAYSGQDAGELKSLTPAQRREATATDTVHGVSSADDKFYNGDSENWSVDFTGVAAGFFSISLGQLTGFESEDTEAAIGLVENFLKYVIHHDVCPEYKYDLNSATGICDLARQEWPLIHQFQELLPACFNLAAAEYFGISEASDWSFLHFTRPEEFDAKVIFSAVCALRGETQTLRSLLRNDVHVESLHTCDLQITSLEHPSDDIVRLFAGLVIDNDKVAVDPVGRVLLEPAVIEDDWVPSSTTHPFSGAIIHVYMESSMLNHLKPGMKLTTTIATLNTGLRFVKTIQTIVPTFYTFLPQQMMKHYKQPRESDRPAPSALDAAENDGEE